MVHNLLDRINKRLIWLRVAPVTWGEVIVLIIDVLLAVAFLATVAAGWIAIHGALTFAGWLAWALLLVLVIGIAVLLLI